MAHGASNDAVAARNHLAAHGWIAKKAEAFRHLPPPPAELWLGEVTAPIEAPEDGWTLQILDGTTAGVVEARWFDAADAAQRRELFASLPLPADDDAAPFAWAHRALVRRGLRLRLGAGESLLRLDRAPVAAVEAPLLLIELAPGASCVLLEAHAAPLAAPVVQNLQVHVQLAQGARLKHLRHVPAGRADRIAHHLHARLDEDAQYAQALLATGSDYHLQRNVVALQGARAAARIDGVLLADGSTLEQQIVSRHGAPHTRSSAEVLALASGAARVVGNVLTHMAPGCDEAEARQKLAGIPTSGQPRIVLRPHLEIHHDQVQASHGATWGALPEEALFFARQRGLDESAAKALILEGLARAALARGVDDDTLPEALRLDPYLGEAIARHLAGTPAKEAAHG
ncbi:SufD family Fe-S cluster assembly protein [Ramlibacter tataouinensis]|uniref:SufD family Fe-S cluster assembly protein n=1 Tax=Ramlibacter tataouinensis TaxID=94132 RepID=UPI0022F38B0F|nr:SufD family Fe-S cluster assembly protein [Ramlibacter tataouinensis]WBY01087.1 SufD family Fe-S cluster assembly protein [Ramlibacter tataouinensis]